MTSQSTTRRPIIKLDGLSHKTQSARPRLSSVTRPLTLTISREGGEYMRMETTSLPCPLAGEGWGEGKRIYSFQFSEP